jgi:hypothetical protein
MNIEQEIQELKNEIKLFKALLNNIDSIDIPNYIKAKELEKKELKHLIYDKIDKLIMLQEINNGLNENLKEE